MKRIALNTAVVLTTLAMVGLVYVFRSALILFLMSLFLAAAVRPLAEGFKVRGISRTTSLVIVYVLVLLVIGMVLAAVSSAVVQELTVLTHQLSSGYDTIYSNWPEGTALQQAIVSQLPAPNQLYDLYSQEGFNVLIEGILGAAGSLGALVAALAVTVVLSVYWSADRVHFERLWLSLLPVESRSRARGTWRDIEDRIGAYLRSELARSFLAGILVGVGLALMGVPYPTLLAIGAALLSLIPWLGMWLIAVPVFLAGSSTSLLLSAAGTIYTVVVLVGLEALAPMGARFFGRERYSSLLMVIIAFVLADSLGLLAILAAPPLTAGIQLFVQHMRRPAVDRMQLRSVRKIADLRERVDHIHVMAEQMEEALTPQSQNMITRLDALVAQANDLIGEEKP